MSSHELNREIISAWQRGWYLSFHGYRCNETPSSSFAKIARKGWNSHARGESCEEGLEDFLESSGNLQKNKQPEEFDRYVASAVQDLREVQRLQSFSQTYPTPHDEDEHNERVHNLLLSAKDNITAAFERWGS